MLDIDHRIREEGRLEGLAEGKLEGLAEGKLKGFVEGWKEKEVEQKTNFISTIHILRQHGFDDETIAKYAKALRIKISLEDIKSY